MDLLSIAVFNLLICLHNLLRQQVCEVRQFSHSHSQCFLTNMSPAPFPNKKLRLFLEWRHVKIISSTLSTPSEHCYAAAKHTSCPWDSSSHGVQQEENRNYHMGTWPIFYTRGKQTLQLSKLLLGFPPQPLWALKGHSHVSYSRDGHSAGWKVYQHLTNQPVTIAILTIQS